MSYTVYILISHSDWGLYVGCTKDFEKRLKAHNSGGVKATKPRRPLAVLHTEVYEDKGEAYQRERYLKSLWSARFKRKLRDEYIHTYTN